MTLLKEKQVQKTQDIITNRVLIFFGVTAIFLWAISYLSRAFDYAVSFRAACTVSVVLIFAGAAGFFAALLWQNRRIRSGKAAEAALSGYTLAWFALALSGASAMMRFYSYTLTMRILYVAMPVAAILYLIYYVYPRVFFTLCFTHSIMAFLLWGVAKTSDWAGESFLCWALFGLGELVCVASLGLVAVASRHGGSVPVLGRSVNVFGKKMNVKALAAAYLVPMALFVAAVLLGIPFAFYALWVVLGFLLLCAVYFTVRML